MLCEPYLRSGSCVLPLLGELGRQLHQEGQILRPHFGVLVMLHEPFCCFVGRLLAQPVKLLRQLHQEGQMLRPHGSVVLVLLKPLLQSLKVVDCLGVRSMGYQPNQEWRVDLPS